MKWKLSPLKEIANPFNLGYRAGMEAAAQKWISVDSEQKPQHGREYLCVCS